MKAKRILAVILTAAMVISTMSFSVFAQQTQNVLPDNVEWSDSYVVTDGSGNYWTSMKAALEGIHLNGVDTLYCKPEADLGTFTHGHVCADLTVYGNGAYFSGGEFDFELDTNKYCHNGSNTCDGVTSDLALNVYNLSKCAVWGQRTTSHKLSITLEGCTDVDRIYISGETGANDITVNNCTFLPGGTACSVYSNAPGSINVTNTAFSSIPEPINLNNKSEGAQIINVSGCTFTDCGFGNTSYDDSEYAAPIRVLTSNSSATSNLTVDGCVFEYFEGTSHNGDVLIGDGRAGKESYPVEASVVNTDAQVQIQQPGKRAEATVVNVEASATASTLTNAVADVNGTKYMSFSSAISNAADGDVVTILADGQYSINKVADITLKAADGVNAVIKRPNGPVTDGDADVIFENLTFDFYPNKNYTGYQYNTTTFNNCTINGQMFLYSYTSAVFNNCEFNQNSADAYNVWTYSAKDVTFNGCTFVCEGKSVLVYNEGATGTAIKVVDTDFIANNPVDGKAAIEVDTSLMGDDITYVDVDETTTANGFGAGSVSGESLWNVKKAGGSVYVAVDDEIVMAHAAGTTAGTPAAAIVNNVVYASLDAAIAGADDNDTVVVISDVVTDSFSIDGKKITVDLNGYTWYLKDKDTNGTTRINHKNGADVKYTNGTINVSEAKDSVNLFGTGVYDKTAATMTFENVTVVGDGYDSGFAVFYLCGNDASVLNIVNSTINLANEKGSAGGVIKADNQTSKVNITGSTMILDNVQRGIVSVTSTIDNSTIEFKNLRKTALRNFTGTINNSTVTVSGAEYGIENDAAAPLTINVTGNSTIKLEGAKEYDMSLTEGGTTIAVEEGSYVYADTSAVSNNSAVNGDVVILANIIEVDFELAETTETSVTYDINLSGYDDEVINRLNSADLTFILNQIDGLNTYEIVDIADDNITFNPVYNPEDGSVIKNRYEFHFEHKEGVTNDTAKTITLAKVKFTGYGEFSFGVNENATTNAVHATTISDNIVDTFVPNGDATTVEKGELVIDNTLANTIAIPRRTLTVNISFPNRIEENVAEYQQMYVTVKGDGVDVKEELGRGLVEGDVVKYTLTFGDTILNTPYAVTVEGEGYRTAKYTVSMTENKTLNFWNNVKDNDTYIEVSESGVKKNAVKTNFLAGDIVKDNNINIYDLSAVVSYFGEIDLDKDNKPEYAKYDLNRDGKIDSKDVAYVLVSWDN